MREKELRLALVCYGGVSLAVYMHGVTKEIWRLARASNNFHAGVAPAGGSQGVYRRLLETIRAETGLELRVFADIVAGASAGGINGVFLAQALATGQSLEPLTDLWLDNADIDKLIDPDARPWSRFSKFWAAPIVWWLAGRKGGTVERTVDKGTRAEVRMKLSRLVRARWFAPPFGGEGFTHLLLDALDAMAAGEPGPRLLPRGQPLDLFVTVTDFRGAPEKLRLNSPPIVNETEHRLVIGFSDKGGRLADAPELALAARATASFPGAFPPFTVGELDRVLAARERAWPGRLAFLKRIMPRRAALGTAEQAAMVDGSVLVNAPFKPAIEALRNRPARREVDRRFVYVDPTPGPPAGLGTTGGEKLPGFFATIFGSLSDLPRSQPIRDNLEAIDRRTQRIRSTRAIVAALTPEVEAQVEALFGDAWFLDRPNAARLKAWRGKAQDRAAKSAGHAYATYAHLKLFGIAEEAATMLDNLSGKHGAEAWRATDAAVRRALAESRLDRVGAARGGASPELIDFFRSHDLGFRIRRLRFLARRLAELAQLSEVEETVLDPLRDALYGSLALYVDREMTSFFGPGLAAAAAEVETAPQAALDALAAARDLKGTDDLTDNAIAEALAGLPKRERRAMLLAYLGFPYYDIATLALLQGEGLDEYDPVKVDRISPDDAPGIRAGAAATLKGIQFTNFGAFFSRAFRENDYLWGRLHGAERMIDIVLSAQSESHVLPGWASAAFKRAAFEAILDEEEPRLLAIAPLFAELRAELAAAPLAKADNPA